jgi:hypothetical protein
VTLPPPGDPRAVRWRYHFTDFRLGRLITTLPMVGVSLSDVLSGASSGSGTVPLSRQVIKRDPFSATVTRRSLCWAERQVIDAGQVVESTVPWAGIVMKRTRQYAGRAIKLDMITFPGYFEHRLVASRTFTQTDKFTIGRTLIRDAVQQLPLPTLIPGTAAVAYPPVTYGTVTQAQWNALIAQGWRGRAGDWAERIYHPLAPATPAPVTYGTVTQAQWDALYAQGWRGRPGDATERFYPPVSLMTYVAPGTPGTLYYAPSPFPTVSPHHYPLDTTTGPLSGVLADRTYLDSDLKTALAAINELAASGDGFDYRFVPFMGTPGDLTTMQVRVDLGYPRLGRVAPPDLRWSTDPADRRQRWGFVEDLTLTEDGSGVNNRVTAVGAGTGADQIRAVADSTETARDEQRAGYSLYESSLNSSTSDDRTYDTVHGKAYGALVSGFASEVQVSGIKVRGDLHPTLSEYALGDDVTIRVGDAVTGTPTTIVGQLVGRTIAPPERGRTEQVTLDIQGTGVA